MGKASRQQHVAVDSFLIVGITKLLRKTHKIAIDVTGGGNKIVICKYI